MAGEMADTIQSYVDTVEANPGKCVTYTWYLVLLFALIDIIVAIVVASSNDSTANGSHAASFAAVWTLFLLLIVSAAGTIILRKHHTPLAVGLLLGLTTMMSQLMFVLFTVFIAIAEYSDDSTLASNDRAMSAFSFFLFILYVGETIEYSDRAMSAFSFFLILFYGVFSIVLGKYRTTVMNAGASKEEDWAADDAAEPLPPPAASGTPV